MICGRSRTGTGKREFGIETSDARQLNGVGGGTSTTSKCAVVSRSSRPGVDVDYTFIQVPLEGGRLDFSGNCGNIAYSIISGSICER